MARRFAVESGVEINFITEDVLAYRPKPASYDLVHDRGFLHTVRPSSWPVWANLVATALKPSGLLIAKEFDYDIDRDFGPRGLTERELRNILDSRFAVVSIERSHFHGSGTAPAAWLVIARRL